MQPQLKTTVRFFENARRLVEDTENEGLVSLVAEWPGTEQGLGEPVHSAPGKEGSQASICEAPPTRAQGAQRASEPRVCFSRPSATYGKTHLPVTGAHIHHGTVYLSLHCIFNLI